MIPFETWLAHKLLKCCACNFVDMEDMEYVHEQLYAEEVILNGQR
jgi:hypothetical protein